MAANPVALILGAGPGIGASVAKKFASVGYNVAIVSRSGSGGKTAEGFLSLMADFSKSDSIPAIFDQVRTEFQAPPSVVVYNAAVRTVPPTPDDMFSVTATTLAKDLEVNTLSPFIAAQQALSGWETLPGDTKKVYIYTGNILNIKTLPMAATITLGMGKSASSFWISLADALHSDRGYRFFYADERNTDGSIKGMAIDGDAHADFYVELAKQESNLPWHATFVKNQGYVQFKSRE